jgi:hypothetical protein
MALKPEVLRGTLKWRVDSSSLYLQRGAVVVAAWDPFVKGSPRGAISIYGEPRGKTVFYKTWSGWKNKVWALYRMRPPSSYHI